MQIVSATAGTLAKLGLAAGTTLGTGNVATLAAVSAAELAGLRFGPQGPQMNGPGRH